MKVTLYNGTTATSYTQTVSSGSTATLSAVPNGTYNIYIGKDSNHKTDMIDSGVDLTVNNNNATATVNYYTLTMTTANATATVNGTSVANNGTVILAGGTTTASSNYGHAIIATANANHIFSAWSKTSGTATIAATSSASTTVKMGGTATIKASALISTTIPTAANYCQTGLVYTGSSQTIVKTAGTGYSWTAGTTKTDAGSQNVTATLASGYIWSDGATGTKTISCSISKATPVITLSASSGTIATGKTRTFTATVKSGTSTTVAGNLNTTSGSTSYATVSPNGNTALTEVDNSTGKATTVTITGVAAGSSTITVKFTPSDTTNFNSATNKTYAATVKTAATIPTAANYCQTGLVYTGSSQTIVKTAGTGYSWTAGTTRTDAGSQNVTATLSSNYAWTDNTTGTKTITCSIGKATPTITLSATSGSLEIGNTKSFTATVKSGAASGTVSGTLNVTSGTTANATVVPANTTISDANNNAGVVTTETITGLAVGSSTITVKFTPSDTTNFSNATNKTYAATIIKRTNLYVSSSGNDSTGNGTIDKPYATIAKAYEMAADSATIYLMSNITAAATTTMESEKDIKLTSCTKSGSGSSATCTYSTQYSIIRGSSLTASTVILLNNGKLTLQNIIVNGNNVSSTKSLVTLDNDAHIVIGTGSVIKNGISTEANGGAVRGDALATIELSGGEISGNKAPAGGGIHVGHCNLIINSGTVTNNTATTDNGGGIYLSYGSLTMNGGSVTNNTAPSGWAGGMYMCGATVDIQGGTINGNTDIGEYPDIYTSMDVISTVTDNNASFTAKASRTNANAAYKIVSAANNNFALDVSDGISASNTNVQLYTYNATNAQQWNFGLARIINGVAYYNIESLVGGSQYLWVYGNSQEAGTNVITYYIHTNSGGFWHLESAGNDYYYIKNGDLCLDVSGGTMANGQNIQAYTCNQTNAQKWKFGSIDAPSAAISMSSYIDVNTISGYYPCVGSSPYERRYTYDISITGGSLASGYMCQSDSNGGSTSYCRSYSSGSGKTGGGVACFNSETSWQYYRSLYCTYASATGTHGLSASKYQC